MNMSYCRFENTSNDLSDCINAMEDAETLAEMDLSKYESQAMKRMAEMAQEFLAHYDRLMETVDAQAE